MPFYLYVFRDNPKRPIEKDVEMAIFRYQRRFDGKEPTVIYVNPNEEELFRGLSLKVEPSNTIQEGFYGVG